MTTLFTCPHCRAQSMVEEKYVGQSGPCYSCGTLVTVPYNPPFHEPQAMERSHRALLLRALVTGAVWGGGPILLVGILLVGLPDLVVTFNLNSPLAAIVFFLADTGLRLLLMTFLGAACGAGFMVLLALCTRRSLDVFDAASRASLHGMLLGGGAACILWLSVALLNLSPILNAVSVYLMLDRLFVAIIVGGAAGALLGATVNGLLAAGAARRRAAASGSAAVAPLAGDRPSHLPAVESRHALAAAQSDSVQLPDEAANRSAEDRARLIARLADRSATEKADPSRLPPS